MEELEINPSSKSSERSYDYEAAPVVRAEHSESSFTRLIEQQTAKLPSDYFLFAALSSMVFSFTMEVIGRRRLSRFVGMWPGPLLTMGVYNKLVKVLGQR